MASLLAQPAAWPIALQAIVGAVIAAGIYYWLTGDQPYAGIPIINLEEKSWKSRWPSRFQWMFRPGEVLEKGNRVSPQCFQIRAGAGWKIILPRKFANELRNHEDLSFTQAVIKDFHGLYPGFESMREGLRPDGLFAELVRIKLTQSLALVTNDLVDEATFCIPMWFGDHKEWKTYEVKQALLDIVARLSTRVFAGKEMARNKTYLHIAQMNTVKTFQAGQKLHEYPMFLRRIVNMFLPESRSLREQVANAVELLTPAVEDAKKRFAEAQQSGSQKASKSADALIWSLELQKGRPLELINIVAGQLHLALAAISTTTEMVTRALIRCVENPEVVQPLREEIISVLKEDGWAKTTLYKMKLMDSFLKECQRSHRLASTSMVRYATKKITLSDGTVIPQGATLMIQDDGPLDSTFYENPEKFDAWRYLNMRSKPGAENRHQFVTTSEDNLGFGHGMHACPGRFFASNEIKILFAFLLLKYDWRCEPGYVRPKDNIFEHTHLVADNIMFQCKRRTEEIDMLNPRGD